MRVIYKRKGESKFFNGIIIKHIGQNVLIRDLINKKVYNVHIKDMRYVNRIITK